MIEGLHLAFCSQFLHWSLLENSRVPFQIIEDLRVHDHETAIDQSAIVIVFFTEGKDCIVLCNV